MRHLVAGKKLNRTASHRIAMLRNMTISLVQHEQIITTISKAVFLRPFIEKMITMGRHYIKTDSVEKKLAIIRLMISRLGGNENSKKAVNKILKKLAPRYKDRNGGYTRIIKYKYRSDSVQTAVIELVDRDEKAKGAPL